MSELITKRQLETALNALSIDNATDTPDYELAERLFERARSFSAEVDGIERFARVFEFADRGQVVAMLSDDNEQGAPAVAFYAQPKDFGVCHISMVFSDDEEGWDKARARLSTLDADLAYRATSEIFKAAEAMQEGATDGDE